MFPVHIWLFLLFSCRKTSSPFQGWVTWLSQPGQGRGWWGSSEQNENDFSGERAPHWQLVANLQPQRMVANLVYVMFEPSCMLKMKQLNTFIGLICLLSYSVELIAKLHLIKKKSHVLQLYYRYIIACVIWKGCNKNYIRVQQHFLQMPDLK